MSSESSESKVEVAEFEGVRVAKFRRSLPDHLRVALLRAKGPVPAAKVARLAGLSPSYVQYLMAGERVPSNDALDRLERIGLRLAPEAWAELRALASR